jgi:hypothetical protein
MYKGAFVTDRDAWNQLIFAREDDDLVQGYEWGECRRYAGFTPYREAQVSPCQLSTLHIIFNRSILPASISMMIDDD